MSDPVPPATPQPEADPEAGVREGSVGRLSIHGAIIAGATGGVLFGINYGLQALVVGFNLTGASGLVSGLTVPFGLAIASQMNREWGTATVAWTLYSLFAIPTVLMGLPGPYKLLVGFIGGLMYDIGYCGTGGTRRGLYYALILYVFSLAGGFYVVFELGIMQEVQGGTIVRVLSLIVTVFMIEGLLSTTAAIWFYKNRVKALMGATG